MKPKHSVDFDWLMGYVYDAVLYPAAHFLFGLILAVIPLLVVYHFFDPTANNWLIISVSMAIFGGLTHNHANRSHAGLERDVSGKRDQIALMEYWHKDTTRRLGSELDDLEKEHPLPEEEHESKMRLRIFISLMKDARFYGFEPVQEDTEVDEE